MTSSSANPPLDYDRLRDSLVAAGAVVALAEVHGGICGAICAGGRAAARRWVADLFDDVELATPAELGDELAELIDTTAKTLDDAELEFEPLLPNDDAPLEEQVEALAVWCQGFLSGFGSTAPDIARRATQRDPLGEVLRDFAQIGRAGLSEDEAEGRGQPDFALAEIHEYVRVSVQTVFEELGPERAAAAREVH